MSILSALTGNATEVDRAALEAEFSNVLVDGEVIQSAYKLVRDMWVFTNKRLIQVDRQGLTGKKTQYMSVPYANVARFAVETAGSFDGDTELSIWLRGEAVPLKQEFRRGSDIHNVHRMLATYVMKG